MCVVHSTTEDLALETADAYKVYQRDLVAAGLLIPLGVRGVYGRGADFERVIEQRIPASKQRFRFWQVPGGPHASLTTAESVTMLRRLIEGLWPAQSGKFFNYDGSEYAW